MQIVVVYEDSPISIDYFSFARGHLDGVNAYHYGNLLHQPRGSAIYFAVDYDAKPQDVTGAILDYFRGVKQGFSDAGQGSSIYDIVFMVLDSVAIGLNSTRLSQNIHGWLNRLAGMEAATIPTGQ